MKQMPYTALCAKKHNHISYRQDGDYSFANNILIAPVSMQELAFIARQYPVLFMQQHIMQPIAILSTDGKQNAYVDQNGKWRDSFYVPQALQIYPFMMQKLPDREAGILLFDQSSTKIITKGTSAVAGRLFTDQKQPTDLLRGIATMQTRFYESKIQADELAALMSDEDLLMNSAISFAHSAQTKQAGATFYQINENAYRMLPADIIEQWFRAGWLDAISLILTSQRIWQQQLAALQAMVEKTGSGHA